MQEIINIVVPDRPVSPESVIAVAALADCSHA